MSKPIKITEAIMEECRNDFEKALSGTKLVDGKITFTKTFNMEDRKATVYFTGEAWTKMVMLIKEFDKEVAWHGVAHRVEDETKDEYVITDILVYPQEVTGASVEMDTEKYAEWIMANVEDERFDNIHMQGHSHVNMSTSPSSVDINHQEEILNMLGDDDFYIFMIWNKSFVATNKIYDLKKNILFEDRDVTVKIVGGVEDLEAFIKAAKDMVKSKTYVYAGNTGNTGNKGYSGYNGYNGYNGYGGNGGGQNNRQTPTTPAVTTPYNPVKNDSSDKKNDDKKNGAKPRTQIGAGWAGKNASRQYDDYDDYAGYGASNWPYGGME